jgi:hypothetical protein
MTESPTILSVVDIVIVAEVDVQTKVFGEPLKPKWSMKVKYTSVLKELSSPSSSVMMSKVSTRPSYYKDYLAYRLSDSI